MWNGFWCYRYLLWNLVSRDFKLKYRRSVLGVVWSVLNPLLMCLVYWAVFSSLMDMRGSGIDNFAVFLMCGQLLFNFFNEATSTGMSSVLGAAPLLKKVYIPKYIFPLEKCCFAMVNCVFSFVALLLVMIFTGAPFHLTLIEAVYPLVTLFFFSLGVGLLLAAATVFFRDIMHIWSVFITALLYFSAISGFATFIGNMISAWNEMQTASLKVSDYRQFMELPDTDGTGTAHAADHREHAPEITFDHVSFRYDGAAHDTLHEISLTLRAGEHVALVGLNGAGKTTLVKLLCGLYAPTSGTIRIDGVPAAEFRRDDYAALFAPVFQEVRTACFSLAETAACAFGPEVDRERAERCLRAAGLGEKLDTLPHGMDTHLDKQVNPDGIELSGGEAQKLMMARALYKDAPVLVLDEPTAALDPIAENEVYEQYRRMAAGKTSLFISHRLASTRFCDRIVLLRDGGIAEEGTHETLLAAGGEYARLYEIQSCWYQPGYQGGKQA